MSQNINQEDLIQDPEKYDKRCNEELRTKITFGSKSIREDRSAILS